MLNDILTVMWKETRELMEGAASKRSGLVRLALPVVIAGILIPSRMGRAYVTGATALLGLLWILPMIAVSLTVDAVAGERERHTLETLLASRLSDQAVLFGKLATSVIYAWATMLLSLVLGLMTVNVQRTGGNILLFSPPYALILVIASGLASILVCSVAAHVSMRAATVRQAAQTFAYGMMAVIFSVIFGFRALPRQWRFAVLQVALGRDSATVTLWAVVAFAALDTALLIAARHRFRRDRVIF